MDVERSLANAVRARNIKKIKTIFKTTDILKDFGKSLWKGTRSESPIHFSACLGQNEILKLFQSFGGNMDSILEHHSGFRETVLHCAIKGNHVSTVELLVHGFHVKTHVASSDGETPLQSAAKTGQNATIRVLKQGGVNIDQLSTNVNGLKETALHCAIRHQHLDTVLLLLDLGADCAIHGHYFDEFSGIALEYAQQAEKEATTQGLLHFKTANDILTLLTIKDSKILPTNSANGLVQVNNSENPAVSPLQLNSTMRRNPKSSEDLQLYHEHKRWERQVQALKAEQGANRARLNELKSKSKGDTPLKPDTQELELLMALMDKKDKDSVTMPPLNRSQSENSFRSKIPIKSGSTVSVRFPSLTRSPSPRVSQASSLSDLREELLAGEGSGTQPQEWDPTLNEGDDLQTSNRTIKSQWKTACTICETELQRVYCCQRCHGTLCGSCSSSLLACPLCRENFIDNPPLRNLLGERRIRDAQFLKR